MKKILLYFLLLGGLFACEKTTAGNDDNNNNHNNGNNTTVEKSIAKGRVTNSEGKPIAGVRIYVDNNIYFNAGISTVTDAEGYYRVRVPQGSWHVYAKHDVVYNGRRFDNLDLHPDVSTAFAGTDGAVRNFTWKLSGEKPVPLAGTYGGLVSLFNDPNGSLWDVENIEFTFTPVGPMIDGSAGKTFTAKSGLPRTDLYSKIADVPIGRYRVTAKHLLTGKTVRLTVNDDQYRFADSMILDFEPALNYCNNCTVIVYSDK